MNNKKSRILIVVIVFFILVIPLVFLYSNINRQITSAQKSIEDNLQGKILNTANKISKKLSPFTYLKEEFDKIHAELFPEFPNEIITGIPDDSELKKLYNEELLNKLITKIKDRYNPIAITVITQNMIFFTIIKFNIIIINIIIIFHNFNFIKVFIFIFF